MAGSRGVKRRAGPLSLVRAPLISDGVAVAVAVQAILLPTTQDSAGSIFGDNAKYSASAVAVALNILCTVSMPVELVVALPSTVLPQSIRTIEEVDSLAVQNHV